MDSTGNDVSARDAALILEWLVAAGADEIMLDAPVDRFHEQVDTLRRRSDPPRPVAPFTPSPTAPVPTSGELAETVAACADPHSLAALFRATDIHGLGKSAQSFCFLEAAPDTRVLVLGDRPRTDEETEGKVFAGKTAELLRNMLKAIGLGFPDGELEKVSLANLVPWRPPGNRTPTELELGLCHPFAVRLIELLRPQLVLALGTLPGKVLAGGASVAQQRGKWLSVAGTPMRVTFHPAELLQYPERKRMAWEDLLEVKKKLDG
jgi:uracil-DNA glycosylase